jgi:hypothetical protein
MASITYYVALPFAAGEDGDLLPGEPVEALNEWQARSRAAGLAIHNAGAVAFSRTGDPTTGEFEPAVVLASHGDLPSDIAEMMGGGT